MGKPPRNILLILNGIVENWLQLRMSHQRYVKIVMKNIFPPKPLINSKSPSNDIAHIKLFKCQYLNFCNYYKIQLNLMKCVKAGLKVKIATVKKRLVKRIGIDFMLLFLCSRIFVGESARRGDFVGCLTRTDFLKN